MSTSNEPNAPPNISFGSIPLTQTTYEDVSSVGLTSPVDLATRTPPNPSFLSSGIPKTPEQAAVSVVDCADVDECYDTDHEIGPFYDQVMDEVDLEEEEVPLRSMPESNPTITTPTINNPTIPPGVDPISREPTSTNLNASPSTNSAPNEPTAPSLSVEDVDKLKVSELKEQLLKRGLSRSGNKPLLVSRLKEAVTNNAPLLLNMSNEIRDNLAGDTFNGGAYWEMVPQDGETVVDENRELIEGERYFDPTVPRNNRWVEGDEVGPPKRNYNATADREVFRHRAKVPHFTSQGKQKFKDGKRVWKEGETSDTIPNFAFLEKNNIDEKSHPAEWVNLFMPWKKDKKNEGVMDMETIANHTNMRIACSTAAIRRSKQVKPFTVDEVMRHFGLFMLNGLNPSPNISRKLNSQEYDPVQGNDMCNQAFDSNAGERLIDFKRFLTLVDPRIPTPNRKKDPNFKINPIIKQLIHLSNKVMIIGKMISVDEQTISFKGRHVDKL